MADDALPDSLRTFLQERVERYEDLEVLLFLRGRAGQWWNSSLIGKHLPVGADAIEAALRRLRGSALIDADQTEASCAYCFPAHGVTASIVDRIARACAERPLAVVRAMTSNALERLRARSARTYESVLSARDRIRGR
jgi:hypothetical protein